MDAPGRRGQGPQAACRRPETYDGRPAPRGARPAVGREISRVRWTGGARRGHLSGTPVARRLARPTRSSSRRAAARSCLALLPEGFAVPPPSPASAVGSYPTLSPLPVRPVPAAGAGRRAIGGLLSVALAVVSRRPGFPRHRALGSPDFPRTAPPGGGRPATSVSLRLLLPSRPGPVPPSAVRTVSERPSRAYFVAGVFAPGKPAGPPGRRLGRDVVTAVRRSRSRPRGGRGATGGRAVPGPDPRAGPALPRSAPTSERCRAAGRGRPAGKQAAG